MQAVDLDSGWNFPGLHSSHAPMLTRGATVPGLQGVCWVLPVGAKWPAVVSVHPLRLVRLVVLEYEPFLHGRAALAPSGQYEPGSQAAHVCSPLSAWYVDGGASGGIGAEAGEGGGGDGGGIGAEAGEGGGGDGGGIGAEAAGLLPGLLLGLGSWPPIPGSWSGTSEGGLYVPAAHLSHAPLPAMGWTVPGLHMVCSVLPVGAKWPAVVSVHSLRLVRLVALEYEPFSHGSAALAPSRQYEPGSQATHLSSPSSAWYVPAAHLSHAPLPAMGWTVPGPHLVCSVLPVGAKLPFLDSVHSLGSVRLVEIEYEPSAHGSGALAPAGQNEPGSQATHACLPSSAWYVPAAHLSQVSCFAMGWTFPGLHLVGSMLARRILAS